MSAAPVAAARRPTAPGRRAPVRHVEQVMGLPVSLALDGRHARTARGRAAWHEALAVLRHVDAVFSTYRHGSWVSRLGRGEVGLGDCPAEVREVLALAERARRDSRGAFDVRLPRGGGHVLDPSGVVKGWAVDRAAVPLRALADTDFSLSAGGDLVAVAGRASATPWRIGVEDPRDPASVVAVVPVLDGAVATSGLVHRGAHVVDPRDGSTPTVWASVTVVARRLVDADVDATAALVLGEDAPAWLERRGGRTALLVRPDGRTIVVAPTACA